MANCWHQCWRCPPPQGPHCSEARCSSPTALLCVQEERAAWAAQQTELAAQREAERQVWEAAAAARERRQQREQAAQAAASAQREAGRRRERAAVEAVWGGQGRLRDAQLARQR